MRDLLIVPTPSPWGLYFQTISDRAAWIYTQPSCEKIMSCEEILRGLVPTKPPGHGSFKHEIVIPLQGTI